MKRIACIFALLAACISWPAAAAGAGTGAGAATDGACVPYTIPIQPTVVACDAGQIGSKYKTQSRVCPSGALTQSADYDTSGCKAPPSPPGSVNIVSRCALTPDACAPSPTAAACPGGTHWTLTGSNIAHCVQDDFACPWGYSLTHDFLGNPECKQNTCPANQVLQGDGISCACPANTIWNGATCIPAPPSCVPGSMPVNEIACGIGYAGTKFQTATTSCPGGPYGSPLVTTSGYDTSTCSAMPVTCTASTYTDSQTCGAGTQYRSVTTSCPGGAWGSPSTAYGTWDTAACACVNGAINYPTCNSFPPPACTPSSSTTSASCGAGHTGTKFITTNSFCPSGTSTSVDDSDCGCANGATNYPSCNSLPPPSCTPSSSTTSAACGTGYTGTKYITTEQLCPGGSAVSVDEGGCGCANGANDYPTCTPPLPSCTPSSNTTAASCGPGHTGTMFITTEQLCPSGTNTSVNDSGCGCANGASDYPTCTPPAPAPPLPPITCPDSYYSCQKWKEGFDKMYLNSYGPAPQCTPRSEYYGLVEEGGCW